MRAGRFPGCAAEYRSGKRVSFGAIHHGGRLRNSSAKKFPINTVLVAMYGATAGEVGILRLRPPPIRLSAGLFPTSGFRPTFYLLLKTDRPALIRLAGGGAQPNISQKIVREFQIPLPPLATQRPSWRRSKPSRRWWPPTASSSRASRRRSRPRSPASGARMRQRTDWMRHRGDEPDVLPRCESRTSDCLGRESPGSASVPGRTQRTGR